MCIKFLFFSANLERVPVDRVIFLRTRVRARQKGSAQLISSEAGVARFWDIFSPKREPLGGSKIVWCIKINILITWYSGSFLLSEFDDESVLAMKVDPKDKYLLAGDTAGFIAIFDIKSYCTSSQSEVCGCKPAIKFYVTTIFSHICVSDLQREPS